MPSPLAGVINTIIPFPYLQKALDLSLTLLRSKKKKAKKK